jgi:hypothetical protein
MKVERQDAAPIIVLLLILAVLGRTLQMYAGALLM